MFAMMWPLYNSGMIDGVVASTVVWGSTVQFLLVGLKIVHDPTFASSMGAPPGQEHLLLRGPVQYGIAIATLTAFFFKSPFSIIPIGILCGGDATAALAGSRFGVRRVPWNQNKVWPLVSLVAVRNSRQRRICHKRCVCSADCVGHRGVRRWRSRGYIWTAYVHVHSGYPRC